MYSNSVLFIRSGGDNRLASLMLALATFMVFVAGPGIVGYIPTVVVGSLIFHLGIELLKEAVYDTYTTTHPLEYTTIWLIVVAMAVFGFMQGIILGLLLACVFFVVIYSKRQVVRDEFSGASVRSTVRRILAQQKYLDSNASQIHVLRLQGFMFFGTADQVEQRIHALIQEAIHKKQRLKFLIVDLSLVSGIDLTAAEMFGRIRRQLRRRIIHFMASGMRVSYLPYFDSLNEALEWCENALLQMMPPARNSGPFGDIPAVSSALKRKSVEAGEVMWSPGDAATYLVVVESGVLRVVVGGQVVESVLPDTIIGESEFFSGQKRLGSLVAETPAVLLLLSIESWEQIQISDPSAALLFVKCAMSYAVQGASSLAVYGMR